MKLADLSPRWVAHEGNDKAALIFKCPHCQEIWLTCTFQPIKISHQMEMFLPEGQMSGGQVVPSKQDFAWGRSGDDFASLSVTPSVDASASGHWHGFITNGECR